jgi:phospholipid/cholesterol/gamma-HCH transport system permease protein
VIGIGTFTKSVFEIFGQFIKNSIRSLGRFVLFIKSFFSHLIFYRLYFRLVVKQLEFVGNNSLAIILLASLFTGAVLGLQMGVIFRLFSAEGMLGAATGKSLALELAPVMCAFIVTGRAGAAIAAEIATMRVNEQIDAMEAMGVNPIRYLVVPRVIASMFMMPLLSAIFLFLGVLGCYGVGVLIFKVDTMIFIQQLKWIVLWQDVLKGLFKAGVFGFIFSLVACYKGFNATGGAKGVGDATTHAVVVALLTILVADFVITLFQV